MTSLITNTSAALALQTLRRASSDLNSTQQEISSGLRVKKASDNSAYWSVSVAMRSDKAAMSAAADSMGIGQALLDVTYTAMEQILEELDAIKALFVTASSLPVGEDDGYSIWYDQPELTDEVYEASAVGKVDVAIGARFKNIQTIIASSSFNGVNLLLNTSTDPLQTSTTEFVIGYADGKVQTASFNNANTVMTNYNRTLDGFWTTVGQEEFGLLDEFLPFGYANPSTSFYDTVDGKVKDVTRKYFLRDGEGYIAFKGYDRQAEYNSLIWYFESRMIARVQSGASAVGSMQKRLAIQENFNSNLMDNFSKGIGRLVDADMEEASSRLNALQTQQKLATESLSIANSAPGAILSLFQ